MYWPRKLNRRELSLISEEFIEEILNGLCNNNLKIFNLHKLNTKELGLMFRWSLYVTSNIFIERVSRVMTYKDANFRDITEKYILNYKLESHEVIFNLYNNYTFNNNLLNLIYNIIYTKKIEEKDFEKFILFNDYASDIGKKLTLKNKIKNLKNLIINKKYKSSYIYDAYHQLNSVFPKKNLFIEMSYEKSNVDVVSRKVIREIVFNISISLMKKLNINISDEKISLLSNIFAKLVDYSLPLSLIENLSKRITFYDKIILNNKIDKIHSAVGYYFNDNIKIFSILSKRKNKNTKLIKHEHGLNNFISVISKHNNFPDFNKVLSTYHYVDYFIAWGNGKIADKFLNLEKKTSMKIINGGNVYLYNIKNSNLNKVNDKNQFSLLFSASPSRDFMANLEEITPEENLLHQKKVLHFINLITKKYKNIKAIYKPFVKNINAEILQYIKKENFSKDNFKISNENAFNIMKDVDIVLFDTLTTGFGEAVSIGVPAIVYDNKFDYKTITNDGKKINDLLHYNNIIFYNEDEGVKTIELILKHYNLFYKNSIESIIEFQNLLAYPRSKKEFNEILKKNNLI